jgi:hypothetical protein
MKGSDMSDKEDDSSRRLDGRINTLMEQAASAGGVQVDDLSDGDMVEIASTKHLYSVKILDVGMRKVEVWSDDEAFKVPVEAHLSGSLFSSEGTMVQSGWIRMGCYLELVMKPNQEGELPRTLVLPETRRISVNGIAIAGAAVSSTPM